ncbi:hypothetical protein NLL32_00680 [Corynebacterium propinquum]|uniref:hypothetical protein n=1 Tax=Corynebacterium propinquum TaxID=43769 RepID=UPI002542B44B|nr:hypothetical protein [Corynebacterium propinquum]MDK4252616.1 hypothetical protein [Corynebacterium propinquum]WKS49447.1 hypothetical protein NLL32_00680 [Corynebacterium propinquum]
MIPVTPRLAGSNVDIYIEHLNAIDSKIQESNRPDSYKDGYTAATKLATHRIAEMWQASVRSALAINEMLAKEGKLDEDLDDAFTTAQAIANTRKNTK